MIGVAREVAAATGVPFTLPPTDRGGGRRAGGGRGVGGVTVQTVSALSRPADSRGRPRPVAAPRAGPAAAAGMRPFSAVIDATNYAMLELGQPLHPFDLALLEGEEDRRSSAPDGELMVTLDDVERSFDGRRPADRRRRAGRRGGRRHGRPPLRPPMPPSGDRILEAASFERGGVQRTRRRIDLSDGASMSARRGHGSGGSVDRSGSCLSSDGRMVRCPGAARSARSGSGPVPHARHDAGEPGVDADRVRRDAPRTRPRSSTD